MAAVAATVSAGALGSAPATAAPTGFVGRNGSQLTVNGQPWRFAGYNLPCANVFALSDAQLGVYLTDIQQNSGANALRVWFFQNEGGPGNWTNFDRVINDIQASGLRAVVTLTNEWNVCDEPSPATSQKDLTWYQSGYQSPEGGYPLSFKAYATAVAAHYASNTTVAFWQLVNEGQAPTVSGSSITCNEGSATSGLRSFTDTMVAAMKAVDPNHLVDPGIDGGCGVADQADYQFVHAGSADLCEYHDYGAPGSPTPSVLAQDEAACQALHKPLFIGEAGIPNDVQPNGLPATTTCTPDYPACDPSQPMLNFTTLGQRAGDFQAKIQAATNAGAAGYLIWVKSPFYTTTTDGYAIADGDPVEGVLKQYGLAPYPAGPPPSVPEAPMVAGLAVIGVVLMGGGAAVLRRRRRSAPAAT